jgi:aspartate carbamoyltransferase catalytic subunit
MSLKNRDMVTLDDFSNTEIDGLFSLAEVMNESIDKQHSLCEGKVMASLFFEPSTRTRLSFETAMHRLGGHVISAVDIGSTSLAKGESIADMARVLGSYADIIVIRHPWEGAARVVADYADVPVINAGDGGHEHPTQTLCDLYTLKSERHSIEGLRIALCGDLKYGRTIHSLAYALARFGATILFQSYPGLEVPKHVLRKLITDYNGTLKISEDLKHETEKGMFPLNSIYITPASPHQLAMMPDINIQIETEANVDALYITRLQKERLSVNPEEQQIENDYPVVDKKLLRGKKFKQALVMHPLPRVDELAYEVDADPRSMYFKQAAFGVPVRMALISLLLGTNKITTNEAVPTISRHKYTIYKKDSGIKCPNPLCVSNQDTEIKYIKPEFKIISLNPLILSCIYCEHENYPPYIASSQWHEGGLKYKKYHNANSKWINKIKAENLILFDSANSAQDQGFEPSSYANTSHLTLEINKKDNEI